MCVLYLYLYAVYGPGQYDVNGQVPVRCAHLIKNKKFTRNIKLGPE